MNKKVLIFVLVMSVVLNIYFLFSTSGIYISKRIDWQDNALNELFNFNEIEASGCLKALNYEIPDEYNILFYIHVFDDLSDNGSAKFYAREIWLGSSSISSVTSLELKEYKIVEKTENHIIAKDDIYTFEVTKDDVFITDKDGKRAKLSDKFIKFK